MALSRRAAAVLAGLGVVAALAVPVVAQRVDGPITPIEPATGVDPRLKALGRTLFHWTGLSDDGKVSCASCHDLRRGGHDPRPGQFSRGVEGRSGVINSPTVYNADLQIAQFWDGRAATVHDQIDGPVQSEIEMASLWDDVLERIYADDRVASGFEALGHPVSREGVKRALAAFVRTLRTVDAPFDRYLRGEEAAISEEAKAGWGHFRAYGCVSCHQGRAVGGNMFQVFGVINSYFQRRGDIRPADEGRFNVTGNPSDRHLFKVPSLRLVRYTAPYLHDGTQATLRDAVDAMFEFQLGREAPDAHKDAIVAFLKTLAGTHPELGPPPDDSGSPPAASAGPGALRARSAGSGQFGVGAGGYSARELAAAEPPSGLLPDSEPGAYASGPDGGPAFGRAGSDADASHARWLAPDPHGAPAHGDALWGTGGER